MQVSSTNNVKVYNLSVGKTLPEWISDRKKRTLLRNDVELRQRIELIQDFTMPIASTGIQTSPDGQYILATGVYKPRVRCYDVNQLSMKFERCLDAEAVNFTFLSEDYSKFVLLLSDRHLEFHAQYGFYYRTRVPKFGRDLAYHFPSCDLYIAAASPEIYRLNLEQGRFLTPITTKARGCNVCEFNSEHQLFTVGTEEGTVECWDPRSSARAGELNLGNLGEVFSEKAEDAPPSVTAFQYMDALHFAIGTATGQVLLYDLRSSRPYLVKDHYYGLPIHSLAFQREDDLVLSADSRILKIWHAKDGSAFTAIQPEPDINALCYLSGTGLLLLATEDTKMLAYYTPSLGPAPRWCSFLDSLTEELEESSEPTIFDDYKFVTSKDLESLGLSHLVGSTLLRAYMHGYFMDMRLYHKAKAIAQPFAYEEYRKQKIKKKIEEARANRIRQKKLPKVNRQLAEKLLEEPQPKTTVSDQILVVGMAWERGLAGADVSNPLGDDRFAALFSNPDYQVDEESEEYQLLHPVVSKREKKLKKQRQKIREQQQQQERAADRDEELEGRPSEEESSSSEDDREVWEEVRRRTRAARREEQPGQKPLALPVLVTDHPQPSRVSLGQRLQQEADVDPVPRHSSAVLGGREMTFKVKKSEAEAEQTEHLRRHRAERREVRRPAGSILPRTRKHPTFWKGKKIK